MKLSKIMIKIAILIIYFISIPQKLAAQISNDQFISNWFDTKVGKENLDINNGTLHLNPYKTVGENNMYYSTDKFSKGDVCYDNQTYLDVNLKYDIYKDELIINPYGESEYIGIILIQQKIESFAINDTKFVKIEKRENNLPEFTTGFYEEKKIAPDFIFYIKYHKDIQKGINDNGVFYNFKENNSFFIDLKNKTYRIKSKNDIIRLFPDQKKQINAFYFMNTEIQKSDLNEFMKKLMKHINNSITIQNK